VCIVDGDSPGMQSRNTLLLGTRFTRFTRKRPSVKMYDCKYNV
jgi:hypothetical protein